MLKEGTDAPPFNLPNHEGGKLSLDDLAGKWVVLWWFVKASTPG